MSKAERLKAYLINMHEVIRVINESGISVAKRYGSVDALKSTMRNNINWHCCVTGAISSNRKDHYYRVYDL